VAGCFTANLLIGWVGNGTTAIATGNFFNAFQLLKNGFGTPEAAGAKCGSF
jgi:hypothetical protein